MHNISKEAKQLQVRFDAEKAAYETDLLQLNQKISDHESQIAYLTAENEKLSKNVIQQLREIETNRQKLRMIQENHRNETEDLKSQIEVLKASNYVK